MRQVFFVGACGLLALACSSGPAQGTEGAACYPNGTCNAALTCLSDLCVNANGDAGNEAGADVVAGDVQSDAPIDASSGCTTYTKSTINAMRTGATNGCFELDAVVTLGVTSDTSSPRLFVQDSAGGDFSAMMGQCSSISTTHPCTVASAVSALPTGHAVTVRGSFVVNKSTTLEELFIDAVTDDGAGTPPAAAGPQLQQVERSSTAANLRYQRVSVSLPGALVMYDWSPSELAVANATSCPYQLGFGMISQTVSFTPVSACTNSTSQPSGQASPNAGEVLIGTEFFQTYKVSSDCRCAKGAGATEPAAISTLSSKLSGILVFDVAGTTGFYYVAPQGPGDAPVANTITPP